MKGDLHPCALRLMQQLPVRTHEHVPEKPSKQLAYYYATKDRRRLAKNPGVGRGGAQGKRVQIGGRVFTSMKEAKEILHIGTKTFYAMLADGRARRF